MEVNHQMDNANYKRIAPLNSLTVLTQEQLIARALESEKAIANENFISLEDLEKEMQNW